MSNFNILKDFSEAVKQTGKKSTSAYDTAATVTRIEGNTAWVHIPGGVAETPVKLTIAAKAGDTVQVRVGGGRAWLTGNATAPPTDDTSAILAQLTADGAIKQLKIQQAEIDILKANYIETKFISSPDYQAEEIEYIYPSDSTYPLDTTYPSDGVNVISGFAIDLTRGLILGAFYSKAIADLEARVTALEQANSVSTLSTASLLSTNALTLNSTEEETT